MRTLLQGAKSSIGCMCSLHNIKNLCGGLRNEWKHLSRTHLAAYLWWIWSSTGNHKPISFPDDDLSTIIGIVWRTFVKTFWMNPKSFFISRVCDNSYLVSLHLPRSGAQLWSHPTFHGSDESHSHFVCHLKRPMIKIHIYNGRPSGEDVKLSGWISLNEHPKTIFTPQIFFFFFGRDKAI